MTYFKHDYSICESTFIGPNTRIWAFTHILPNAVIGADCNLCDHVFVEDDVVIGDRVTVKSGVQLWNGLRISDDVFIGPNVTFTNDNFPRSRQWKDVVPLTKIEKGASIGANSTILGGITIGEGCMIGAGSVVTTSIPPFAIAYGNPARIEGYVTAEANFKSPVSTSFEGTTESRIDVSLPGGSRLSSLPEMSDARGSLMALDFVDFEYFKVNRIFYVYDVPTKYVRGEHAHKSCSQFLLALTGSLKVLLDDGVNRNEVVLDSPNLGLYIPPMVWGTQFQFSTGTILAVMASDNYDSNDYIRSYSEFKQLIQ
jgi:UDP-2-acetamido-3-amino-2,3-dideoxy-glucuronate N-acetyltransferase